MFVIITDLYEFDDDFLVGNELVELLDAVPGVRKHVGFMR